MDDPVTYQAVVALNINPLLVHNEGHGCSVEDFRIRVIMGSGLEMQDFTIANVSFQDLTPNFHFQLPQ